MTYQEITSQSWLRRLGKSLSGVIVGILLFFAGIIGLWINERNSVETAESLEEGAANIVRLDSPIAISDNNGKLVHLSGNADTPIHLSDPDFGLDLHAIQLKRYVEMYQWQEKSTSKTRTKLGGGTETVTTYTYDKVWSDERLDSSNYKEPGHTNPSSMPLTTQVFMADPVVVGDFILAKKLIRKIDDFQDIPPPSPAPRGYTIHGARLYQSASPSTPEVGDIRICFTAVMPTKVSIIAAQNEKQLTGYQTKRGGIVELLEEGTKSADAMFANAQAQNTILTWIFRLVGAIAIFFGCIFVLTPLKVAADILPFLGSIIEIGIVLMSLLVTIPVVLATIAISWIAARPILGVILLVLSILIPTAILTLRKKNHQSLVRRRHFS